eukprot:162685-Pyramimonas_sp.AAC.2
MCSDIDESITRIPHTRQLLSSAPSNAEATRLMLFGEPVSQTVASEALFFFIVSGQGKKSADNSIFRINQPHTPSWYSPSLFTRRTTMQYHREHRLFSRSDNPRIRGKTYNTVPLYIGRHTSGPSHSGKC